MAGGAIAAHEWQVTSRLVSDNAVAPPDSLVPAVNVIVSGLKQSGAMLGLAIGTALLALAPGLALPTKKVLRGTAAVSATGALIIQFVTANRNIAWHPQDWRYGTFALTALAALFFALRFFEEIAGRRGTPRENDDAKNPNESRLSRLALWGAVWAPFAVCVFVAVLLGRIHPAMGVIGVAASCATTILGAVAIAHIKRSRGRFYGLRLAAADALFFPLLAVGALAFWLTNLIAFTIAFNLHAPPVPVPGAPPEREPFAVIDFAVLDSLAALTVMSFAGRAAWRAISEHQKTAVPSAGADSGRNYWFRIPLGLAGLALLWLASSEILGVVVTLATTGRLPVEVTNTVAGFLAAFICLLILLVGWRSLFCWELENREDRQPFLWRCMMLAAVCAGLGLAVMGARGLGDEEAALRHATERAEAVVTKTASGTALRFETAGRTIDLPVKGTSMGWGSKVRLRYPPGQPEAARSIGNFQSRQLRNALFLLAGLIPALAACRTSKSNDPQRSRNFPHFRLSFRTRGPVIRIFRPRFHGSLTFPRFWTGAERGRGRFTRARASRRDGRAA